MSDFNNIFGNSVLVSGIQFNLNQTQSLTTVCNILGNEEDELYFSFLSNCYFYIQLRTIILPLCVESDGIRMRRL